MVYSIRRTNLWKTNNTMKQIILKIVVVVIKLYRENRKKGNYMIKNSFLKMVMMIQILALVVMVVTKKITIQVFLSKKVLILNKKKD